MKNLPSLNAVRAFDATARHLSVTLAAQELHVTPGAVSRQVRQLEQELGVALFLRGHQQIALTKQGAEYASAVSRALFDLRGATEKLLRRTDKRQLNIRAYTTFSMSWLIPRLPEFHSKHPDIEVTLTASLEDVDFSRDDLDGAIRLGNGRWAGANVHWLVPNLISPVISPTLLKIKGGLTTPSQLAGYPLLHSIARTEDWTDWLKHAQVRNVDGHAGTMFQSSAMAHSAAVHGQGVAIAQRFLVERELSSQELIEPFDIVLDKGEFTYYLLTPSDRPERPQMQDFKNWILGLFEDANNSNVNMRRI